MDGRSLLIVHGCWGKKVDKPVGDGDTFTEDRRKEEERGKPKRKNKSQLESEEQKKNLLKAKKPG